MDLLFQVTPEVKGKEVLVPLTSCMYVPGTIADAEKLLIDIGTGYYVERVSGLLCFVLGMIFLLNLVSYFIFSVKVKWKQI